MAIFVVTPKLDSPKNRSDAKNFVVSAANAGAAIARAEALAGETAGTFSTDDWRAIQLTDTSAQDFAVEGRPIGLRSGTTWKPLDRGGNYLAI